MSRREGKTPASIMNKVDNTANIVKEISDKLVKEYCEDLDSVMYAIQDSYLAKRGDLTDTQVEHYIIELANTLYFTGSAQEDLGIKEDTCKAIRAEIYNKTYEDSKGTVAQKNALSELATQQETIVLNIYSRAYKKVKLRMDAGYEMLNSLKKVMNKRISEMELSNSRYIGGNRNEEKH